MSENFKAVVLDQVNGEFTRKIKTLEKDFLKQGDVLVKVQYSTLNYKDALILKNGARLVKEYPHIPGIDFSGTVIESNDNNFGNGEDVLVTGGRIGEIYYGGYSQLAKVKKEFLVKKPKNFSNRQAMILGTAGFTALLCSFAIKAREELLLGEKVKDVLVTGATGGVGSIAVMILSKFGYNVTAVTGKNNQSDYLKELGAKNIIDRKEFETEPKLLDKSLWDGVVDTVGGKILSNAISQTKYSGIVAACGNASDIKINTNVMPFIIRGVKLWGIDSVMVSMERRKFIWSEISKFIDFDILEKGINEVDLSELLETYPKMLKGEIAGRVLVKI
ncbi:MAG: zinc-binding alcohol dehydrogenase [Candidatus Pelagibacter sp. TMED64]|nr:zinc-binding alcohol dehydrogenase [Candidatus Pelagibacter sp.]OUU65755.1 MAG: zinc-binding alcohol dehydrogenase [Candidatus Pelagibacter sp. TMED64]